MFNCNPSVMAAPCHHPRVCCAAPAQGRLKDERKTSTPGRLGFMQALLWGTFLILSLRSNAFKKLRKICFKYFLQCNEITDKNISSFHFDPRIGTPADRRSYYVHFCYRLFLGQPRCKPQPFYIFTKMIIIYFYFHIHFQKRSVWRCLPVFAY